MIRKFIATLLIGICGITANNAQALGVVSRACSMRELNSYMDEKAKVAMLLLFKAISEMTVAEFAQILRESSTPSLASQWWALESITTDYLFDRYYLFAKTKVMRLTYESPTNYRDNRTNLHSEWTSKGWKNEAIDPALLENPKIQMYMNNRKWLRSARAGHPSIFVKVAPIVTGQTDVFTVYGQHWWVDPVNGASAQLNNTKATNCNLSNIGAFDR